MQHIKIKYMGPVKDFEADITQYIVLIGEQATGKSTIAKCIYFFKTVQETYVDCLQELLDTNCSWTGSLLEHIYGKMRKNLTDKFIHLFGWSKNLDPNLFLVYYYDRDVWIRVTLEKHEQYIHFEFSSILMDRLNQVIADIQDHQRSQESTLRAEKDAELLYKSSIDKKVKGIFSTQEETYYIPAGRSMITLLAKAAKFIAPENLDLLTMQFMFIIARIRNDFSQGIGQAKERYVQSREDVEVANTFSGWMMQLLKADYYYAPLQEKLVLRDNKADSFDINFASSGQQEMLWLLNLLYVLLLRKEKSFIVIEEPETHVHPDLQYEIMSFIIAFAQQTGSSVLITTHSPYIMLSANNMYYAGSLYSQHKLSFAQMNRIMEHGTVISPNAFSGYSMTSKGQPESLVDIDIHELLTEKIDTVSYKIEQQYLQLVDIDNANKEDVG